MEVCWKCPDLCFGTLVAPGFHVEVSQLSSYPSQTFSESQSPDPPQKEQQKDTTKTEKDTITTLGNLDIWAYEKLHCLDPQGA